MITGMLPPTAGRIQVAGGAPAAGPGQLAKVGFVAQDAPVYAGMSIADHFKLGAHLNPRWDMDLARLPLTGNCAGRRRALMRDGDTEDDRRSCPGVAGVVTSVSARRWLRRAERRPGGRLARRAGAGAAPR
jgi:ABC-type sugar transport system ATPase subunit